VCWTVGIGGVGCIRPGMGLAVFPHFVGGRPSRRLGG
jgi:hypothetical protein